MRMCMEMVNLESGKPSWFQNGGCESQTVGNTGGKANGNACQNAIVKSASNWCLSMDNGQWTIDNG
jgi:hypothetical protein